MNNSEIFEMVNNVIINEMEKGNTPWRKPWTTLKDDENNLFNYPCNYVTKRQYSGINALILGCSQYSTPFFLTFEQVQQQKAQVKKGAKGLPVVFWKPFEVESTNKQGEKVVEKKFLLKYYKVFNVEDTTINYQKYVVSEPLKVEKSYNKIDSCEEIINGYKNRPVLKNSDRKGCYYVPSADYINMISAPRFKTANAYYCTYFHELVHSTGHTNRLKREGVTGVIKFGSANYSFEELIAEIGASYLCNFAKIVTPDLTTNSASYINGWLSKLKSDKTFFYKAAKEAEKAVAFILQNT